MIRIRLLFFLAILSSGDPAFSQDYSYTHYDITDGLAGSTTYCITQDKDGFIWVGTETGLSRFDGTHFRNFTTAEGLPDIEILQLFGDSRGRVWMAPFKRSVCYYYRDSIHNQKNDPVLGAIVLRQNIESFAEDAAGNILLQERTALHLITPAGAVLSFDSLGGEPIRNCVAVSRSRSGHFLVQTSEKIIEFSEKGVIRSLPIRFVDVHPNYIALTPSWGIWRETATTSMLKSFRDNRAIEFPFEERSYKHISFSLVDDSLVYFNEMAGTVQYNIHTGERKRFLPGREVSRTFRDATGNTWFTTLGEGIFRLNSDEFRTVSLPSKEGRLCSVYSIARIGNELWAGTNDNMIFGLTLPKMAVKMSATFTFPSKNRILFIDTIGKDKIGCASDLAYYLTATRDMHCLGAWASGMKSIAPINDHRWLIGSNTGAVIVDPGNFSVIDTLWRERVTVVYYWKDTCYIGTLNGLYRIPPGKAPEFLGERTPFLRKRISSLARSEDGILWIASYDNGGIIGYRHDSVITTITTEQGLTSSICRDLLVHNNLLWVGTDKGLNKIELDKPGWTVTRYTSNDGLGSDLINTIFGDGDMIYVGTSTGLSFFDQSRTDVGEGCRLELLAVINSGRNRLKDSADLVLSYEDKHTRFEFAGISYRSVGGIRYRYRMLGLDSAWRETRETFLEYPIVPSGHYQLQLQAVNKFGSRSPILSLSFLVTTPFWQTVWFEILVLAVLITLAWILVSRRIRNIRRQQDEKERLIRKSTEMENRALQAQMNPHFIFNCMTSIQQYIFEKDIYAANRYITGVARLIRATLHHSSRSVISVTEEVDYLSTYLSLEKMRFKDKMDYFIEIDPGIDKDNSFLPPMLIQPYVENSMRHGLRHKIKGKGYIRVMMRQQGQRMVITIEDNGIGREKAMEYKTAEHIEYQSKGMLLTAERIKMISAIYGSDIDVRVEDIVIPGGEAGGTRVIMNLPEF